MAWFRTDPQEVMKETVLWTNPSPSASFDGQNVTLSDDATNYDYIKIKFRAKTTSNTTYAFIYSLEDIVRALNNNGYERPACQIGSGQASNSLYGRRVYYNSETEMRFTACAVVGGSTNDNTQAIPLQIIGIKRGIEVNPMFDMSLPPDAIYQNTLSNGATYTLSVTQKPKYVVLTLKDSTSSSTGSGYLFGIVNVETGVGYRYGYWSSAFRNGVWTNWSSYITSITDNSVTIANMYGTACYTTIGAYY